MGKAYLDEVSSFPKLDFSKRQSFWVELTFFQHELGTTMWHPYNSPVQDVENGGGLASARWTLRGSSKARLRIFCRHQTWRFLKRLKHQHDYQPGTKSKGHQGYSKTRVWFHRVWTYLTHNIALDWPSGKLTKRARNHSFWIDNTSLNGISLQRAMISWDVNRCHLFREVLADCEDLWLQTSWCTSCLLLTRPDIL